MVLPAEVQEFLKARPDIASKHHPMNSPVVSVAGFSPPATRLKTQSHSPFPDEDSSCGPIGDLGISIILRSLGHTTPSERGLVAKCLLEIARQINETIPTNSGNNMPMPHELHQHD